MYRNVGKYDRLVRIVFGVILLLIGLSDLVSKYLDWVFFFFAVLLIFTGVVGWCGLYALLGHSSKGHGIDKITRKDIEKAVKQHPLSSGAEIINISANRPKTKKAGLKKPVKKVQSKKSVAKKESVKPSSASTKSKTSVIKKPVVKKKKIGNVKKTPVKKSTKNVPAKKKSVSKSKK